MTAQEYLHERHLELRNDCSKPALLLAIEIAQAFVAVGLLTQQEADLTSYAFKSCPGHDDEGGRDWCAYCQKR